MPKQTTESTVESDSCYNRSQSNRQSVVNMPRMELTVQLKLLPTEDPRPPPCVPLWRALLRRTPRSPWLGSSG